MFYDKDLAHCLVKQAMDYLWLNKTLPNISYIYPICSILFYQNLVKSLPNLWQIFNKNLINNRSTDTILAMLGE